MTGISGGYSIEDMSLLCPRVLVQNLDGALAGGGIGVSLENVRIVSSSIPHMNFVGAGHIIQTSPPRDPWNALLSLEKASRVGYVLFEQGEAKTEEGWLPYERLALQFRRPLALKAGVVPAGRRIVVYRQPFEWSDYHERRDHRRVLCWDLYAQRDQLIPTGWFAPASNPIGRS